MTLVAMMLGTVLVWAGAAGQAPQGAELQQEELLKVGQPAPPFALNNQDGKAVRLADFKDKQWVVLAFFPKANTGG